MADFNSSLPVRTQTTGDLVAEIAGASGITVTSTTISTKEALDVNVANSITATNPSVSPTAAPVPASATLIGGHVSAVVPVYIDDNIDALSLTNAGALRVDGSGVTQPVSGTFYQATQPVSGTFWQATQPISAAALPLPSGAATSANQDTEIASLASIDSKLTSPLAVTGPLTDAELRATPVPVTLSGAGGDPIAYYQDFSAIGAGSSADGDYTVTAGKTLYLQAVEGSASGKARLQISIESGVASDVFDIIGVQFNSAAAPNMSFQLPSPKQVAAGVRVRITVQNRDLSAEDIYSSIMGYEV